MFLAELTVLRLTTTISLKNSEISYLSEFIAEASQIVFLADLTVCLLQRLITTVSLQISEVSYLCELSAQLSHIVFLVDVTVLWLITIV